MAVRFERFEIAVVAQQIGQGVVRQVGAAGVRERLGQRQRLGARLERGPHVAAIPLREANDDVHTGDELRLSFFVDGCQQAGGLVQCALQVAVAHLAQRVFLPKKATRLKRDWDADKAQLERQLTASYCPIVDDDEVPGWLAVRGST